MKKPLNCVAFWGLSPLNCINYFSVFIHFFFLVFLLCLFRLSVFFMLLFVLFVIVLRIFLTVVNWCFECSSKKKTKKKRANTKPNAVSKKGSYNSTSLQDKPPMSDDFELGEDETEPTSSMTFSTSLRITWSLGRASQTRRVFVCL